MCKCSSICVNFKSEVVSKSFNIAKRLNIFEDYSSYGDIPPAKLAWITIKSNQQGKDPKMVKAGIKAHYARIHNSIYGK